MNTMKIETSQKAGNLKIQGMHAISVLNTHHCSNAKEYNLILYMNNLTFSIKSVLKYGRTHLQKLMDMPSPIFYVYRRRIKSVTNGTFISCDFHTPS